MNKISKENLKLVSIDAIIPNPKNPNKHSPEQIDRLVKLIKNTGFRNPLIVSNRSGFLIVGHGRLEAAKKLGMKDVPVIFQDFANEADEYAYMTADNALASWSELNLDAVKEEIKLMEDFDFELLGLKEFNINPIEVELPEMDEGNPEFQHVTFILSNEQKDLLDEAMEKALKEEHWEDEINKNKNGNVLAAILRRYV